MSRERDDFVCEVCGRDEGDLCETCEADYRIEDEKREAWMAYEDHMLYAIPIKEHPA